MNLLAVSQMLTVSEEGESVEPWEPRLWRVQAFERLCRDMGKMEGWRLQAVRTLALVELNFENLEASMSRLFEATHYPFCLRYEVSISQPRTFAARQQNPREQQYLKYYVVVQWHQWSHEMYGGFGSQLFVGVLSYHVELP